MCNYFTCTRVIQKVSYDGLLRKKQEYITNHVYCHLMYIPYTTFRHGFHHCWGTCHSAAPVFVSLHRRMMPPAMQSKWKRLFWPQTQFCEEVAVKFEENGVMVNHLFFLTFSSTACTKSSFTTDGRPLRGSSCTFSRPSLKSRTHLHTIELLTACSPYTSQSWRWISASVMFFAFKKRITGRISHAAGFSIFLNIINTQHDA